MHDQQLSPLIARGAQQVLERLERADQRRNVVGIVNDDQRSTAVFEEERDLIAMESSVDERATRPACQIEYNARHLPGIDLASPRPPTVPWGLSHPMSALPDPVAMTTER